MLRALIGLLLGSVASAGALDGFVFVSGRERVGANGRNMTFHMDPPDRGMRMDARARMSSARVCGDVYGRSQPGAVFAMYATTGEPAVRTPGAPGFRPWWELDFEFLGKNPAKVWVNSFVAGRAVGPGYVALPRPFNVAFTRFCLEWDVAAGTAAWRVGGRKVWSSAALRGSGPMRPIVSFWTGTGDSAAWAGGSAVTKRVTMVIRNFTSVDKARSRT
jgi:hypothetical protein